MCEKLAGFHVLSADSFAPNQLYSVRIKFANNFGLDSQWAKRTLLLPNFTAVLIHTAFKSTCSFKKKQLQWLAFVNASKVEVQKTFN